MEAGIEDAGRFMDDRLRGARERMREEDIDLLVRSPGDDLSYLISYTPHPDERPCYLFVTTDVGLFLVPELNAAESAGRIRFPTLTYADAHGPGEVLREARQRLGAPQRVAVGDTMRADALLLLQDTWPQARFISSAPVMATLRMVKSAEEIDRLRRAAATADAAVRAVFAAARPGMREDELARVAEDAFRRQGVQEVAFAIIASGPNSAFPHHRSGARRLQPGEPLLVDIGGRLNGYMSDITRMAYLGDPSQRYREIHAIVEEAVKAGLAVIRPGVPIHDVDVAARDVIERAGYGAHFTHRTGHGIGITGHESPSITNTNDRRLEAGMAFSVEPGIYLVEEFGVRLEEIVVVTPHGAEVFSALPRDVHVIPV